jgi:hypothetical protein
VGRDDDVEYLERCFAREEAREIVCEDLEVLLAEANLSVSRAYQQHKRHSDVIPDLAAALGDVFSFCKENNVDLWAAIDEKEAYNRTRAHRHGGKKV